MRASSKRTRGRNKKPPWKRDPNGPVSVFRLALDTTDPIQRARIEGMFSCAFKVRRALQHDVRNRSDAYWAAKHERAKNPTAVRARLGLSRNAIQYAAYAHLDAALHLHQFLTKHLALHLANSVWSATERHLFCDASGRRHGRMRIGHWSDFTRLPGGARLHTRERKWKSFRLHGSLVGHRVAYTTRGGDYVQPTRLRQIESDAWWDYEGPFAVVFTGLANGTLVLPVRLPTAPSNQACLEHYLADPSKWHKIDLVRHPDPNAVGGWRYEAHLMVLIAPYVSPTVAQRRAETVIATADRQAGIDVNVSNITVASHVHGREVRITRVVRDETRRAADHRRSRQERRQQRDLDRSRRATNSAQYQLSKRQEKRARRRADAGLRPQDVIPAGPRKAISNGKPLQSFRRDKLSKTYQRGRLALAADAGSAAQARRDHARLVAGDLVHTHGYVSVVEDCSISAWSRSWGRALAAFTPGMLISAIEREATAVARIARSSSSLARASTRTTAMSQHCPCGARVPKTLANRVHSCPECGLHGNRDAVSAVLASFVTFGDRAVPSTALVDYDASRAALDELSAVFSKTLMGWQGTQSESNALTARHGTSIAQHKVDTRRRRRGGSAKRGRASRSTPNETGVSQTKSERARMRTHMSTRGPR